MPSYRLSRLLATSAMASLVLTGCAGSANGPQLPPASFVAMQEGPGEEYVIGPLDELTIFVWRNPELGASVQVRPDGRITTPLISDMPESEGAEEFFLEMRSDNDAVHLYESAGFSECGRRPHYYRGGDGVVRDAITMRRR